MSDFHYKTYKQVYTGALSQDSQYLVDIAFPNPTDPELGLYKTNDIKKGLAFADEKWVKKNGFRYTDGIIVGPGFDADRIGVYSSKYTELLKIMTGLLRPNSGKIFVYHNVVHISGVLFIEQLLLANGFIGVDQSETEGTLCATCGKPRSEHVIEVLTEVEKDLQEILAKNARIRARRERAEAAKKRREREERKKDKERKERTERTERNIKSHRKKRGGAADSPADSPADYKHVYGGSYGHTARIFSASDLDALADMEADVYGYDEPRIFEGDVYALQMDGEYVGMIEYYNIDGEVGISSIVVDPAYRGIGVARQMLEETLPPGVPVALRVWKKWKESAAAKEFFDYVGFDLSDDDDDYWYFVYIPDEDDIQENSEPRELVHVSPYITDLVGGTISSGSAADGGTISGGGKALPRKQRNPIKPKRVVTPGVHVYVPARFMVAHSDMDKGIMQKNIDKFNMDNNLYGDTCKAIIGSKIVKQSYNFIGILWQLIVGRPDNISVLIQIMGRVLRSRSHSKLPQSMRHVTYRILTSCLPTKKKGIYELSHEETKYAEKIADYIIIQSIEKVMHENAIDGVITRNIIAPGLDPENKSLGALWYEPKQKQTREYKISDLNLSTFDVFHSDDEVNYTMYLIKRLFIEVSPVFKYADLWERVRKPPFKTQLNTQLIQEQNFVIALDMLVHHSNSQYVQPLNYTDETPDHLMMFDLLHQTLDKRIVTPDGAVGYVHYIGDMYIFIPMDGPAHLIQAEAPFRSPHLRHMKPINVFRYVKESSAFSNYENRKRIFKNRYEGMPFNELSSAIGQFGAKFHIQFIEEIIQYVFDVWTNPLLINKSEYHNFYFKMLYFYDLIGLIIWASTAKDYIRDQYKLYLMSPSESKHVKVTKELITEVAGEEAGDLADVESLSKSLTHLNNRDGIKESRDEYYNSLKLSDQLMSSRSRGQTGVQQAAPGRARLGIRPGVIPGTTQVETDPRAHLREKVPLAKRGELEKPPVIEIKRIRAVPRLLPVGHFMSNVPRFYHPDKNWFESPEYTKKTHEFKENNIIIGYHEKSATSLHIRFKMRNPMHLIKRHKDIRMVEKGSMCSSNSKPYLTQILTELKGPMPEKVNVPNLCAAIERQLIQNELNERRKRSNIKWFYQFWETRPDERQMSSSVSSS